jgi:hypothetical protein
MFLFHITIVVRQSLFVLPPQMVAILFLDDMSMKRWCTNNWQSNTEVLCEKPFPVPLRLPQNPHSLPKDRTWASKVRSRRTYDMAIDEK